ncbi:uncharacterized protein EDB91DRAFT_1189883 [Suillus paluster]|uniref:uncharacterized protein n=1 Tax=Suillus paluster TaxID=48578 RepID=UPI001B87A76D|nr:uncharacterized protein EDB91DRAFT_1189883 [Suillus paluster]KAG1717635.1 hypothetical protein EDB91DRAFT_1189883 [Suillus paluster]
MHWVSNVAILWLLFAVLVSAADLYKVLELSKHASEQDIRKAYKRLSRKYHPDKNTDPGAEDKFVDIAHAYEVLSDTTKRQIYDRHGEEGLRAHEGGQQHHAILSTYFPTSSVGAFNTQQQVSLADMYMGANIDEKDTCDHCRGSGAASDGDIHTCSGCGGHGVKTFKQQIFPACLQQSAKVVEHIQHYTLELQPGTPEGFEVVFEGEGDENPDWEAGDVVLRVRSRKDKGAWSRKENSLLCTPRIQRNITHLDGHVVEINRQGVTQPSYVQTIEGEGMPLHQTDNFGDLFIEYNVVLPVELSSDIRQKLAEAFYGSSHRDRDEL